MDDLTLHAWRLPPVGLGFDVAPARRRWMDRLPQKFANRCLPLLMANASGWALTQVGDVTVRWDGNPAPGGVQVTGDGPAPPRGHFGSGIVTWRVPYLFRTPPGWNLLLRGPANEPRHGAAPLEGLIESDWMTQTTTFSWQMTAPGRVTFPDGATIAMVVPARRDDLEAWAPVVEDPPPEVLAQVEAFRQSRAAYNTSDRAVSDWQRHYMSGHAPDGTRAVEHRRRRRLRSPDAT